MTAAPTPEAPTSATGLDLPTVAEFRLAFVEELRYRQGVELSRATPEDLYSALGRAVRRPLMDAWLRNVGRQIEKGSKAVAYLSAEYLLGRQLQNALLNADLESIAREALAELDLDLDELIAIETEPGLGNGGLGRLAACFVDSLATIGVPAVGYGIRYEYGIFRQTFVDGEQVEQPDTWLSHGNPWEFAHFELTQSIGFGGYTEDFTDERGALRRRWVPGNVVYAVPYNYMVPGYRNGKVNVLRLWSARATEAFDLQVFNAGDYEQAVRNRVSAENLSKVLYPEDSTPQGKELRLAQQYFFAAASVRDFIENTTPAEFDLRKLPERVIFQLNDTHPVIAIPELMRVLIDEKHYDWEDAWEITRNTFAYTCHTLMPEALEVWSVELMQRLLPRHMELIYEINARFLDEVRLQFPGDAGILTRMSIIQEHPARSVRMAHLAVVGSKRVNGVAELHSQLLRDKVLSDFSRMSPEKFTNVTNGVTPRRFIAMANPGLTDLITSRIGSAWITDLDQLRKLEPLAADADFRTEFAMVKAANKQHLADVLEQRDGILIDTTSMYDVMVKRLHEYKRQTLKLLHIVTLYRRLKADPTMTIVPRTFIFGAKAAPGYAAAKQIIALIHAVGRTLDEDPSVAGRLKIAFPANYNVTLAEDIVPAAELSEQISLAGKEASGTGNMKFALNGALTIGTLDGANVEIRDLVGADNFFLFGLTEQEVSDMIARGYKPSAFYESDVELKDAIDALASGDLSQGDYSIAAPVVHRLLAEDPFLVLADYRTYIDAQDQVDATYRTPDEWNTQAILNIARSGFFSSDRAIRDYLDRIWHAAPA